jgi:imidazolonepropionase
VAVLLPATMVFLGQRRQAPARRLLEAGAAVALATDLNPGTSPTLSLPLVMTLGVSQLGLTHAEAVTAVTVNAAAALGRAHDRGQIVAGARADLVSFEVVDWREVAYWMGPNLVTAVWTGGSACPLPPAPVSLGSHVEQA